MVLLCVRGELFAWRAAPLLLSQQRLQQNWQSSARTFDGEPATHEGSFGESHEVEAFHTAGQDCSNKHATGAVKAPPSTPCGFESGPTGLAGAERDNVAVVLRCILLCSYTFVESCHLQDEQNKPRALALPGARSSIFSAVLLTGTCSC